MIVRNNNGLLRSDPGSPVRACHAPGRNSISTPTGFGPSKVTDTPNWRIPWQMDHPVPAEIIISLIVQFFTKLEETELRNLVPAL